MVEGSFIGGNRIDKIRISNVCKNTKKINRDYAFSIFSYYHKNVRGTLDSIRKHSYENGTIMSTLNQNNSYISKCYFSPRKTPRYFEHFTRFRKCQFQYSVNCLTPTIILRWPETRNPLSILREFVLAYIFPIFRRSFPLYPDDYWKKITTKINNRPSIEISSELDDWSKDSGWKVVNGRK